MTPLYPFQERLLKPHSNLISAKLRCILLVGCKVKCKVRQQLQAD
jgi:hypothetical protein